MKTKIPAASACAREVGLEPVELLAAHPPSRQKSSVFSPITWYGPTSNDP